MLAALAAALVFVPLGSPAATVGDCTPGAGFRPANAAFATEVTRLVNQHRATLGLRALKVSPTLTASAVWKARHMATYGYMGHDDPAPPVARTAADRIAACGYRGSWGENVAAGFATPAAALAAWLQSPGHRANIENPAYVVTGAGASVSTGGITLWAQDFGMSDDSGPSPPATPAPPAAQGKLVLERLRVTQPAGRLVLHVRAVLAPSMQPLRNGEHRLRGVRRRREAARGRQALREGRGDLRLARLDRDAADQGDRLREREGSLGARDGLCHPALGTRPSARTTAGISTRRAPGTPSWSVAFDEAPLR